MSFAYSNDFTKEQAQQWRDQYSYLLETIPENTDEQRSGYTILAAWNEPEPLQIEGQIAQLVVEGKLVTRRFEWAVGVIYVVSMLAVVAWGIYHANLDVATLAAGGLASISLATLFSSKAWRNAGTKKGTGE